ncbi:hypothetical protein [Acetobacter estunensis]|uniref:nSTAND3 domain-containing NTPase n=1 Tax=Acetobacter estunensis TaxID=104097 RepID=UPI001C2DA198|nr:hypothetical protein [Acetobacter estunensis]MBV1838385.1 hypothetical protein [Acetobacter estunensis]
MVSAGADHKQEEGSGGSGGHSIAGYEYQIDVSVWLALDLVLANNLAQELILEPASEEDIEADLAENEPGRLTSTAALDGYRLIVQAKSRSGDAWTVAGVKALLKHGETRPSAAKRLEDGKVRYLLITSAGLNGGTRGLRVRRAGSWPKSGDMPATIKSALPAGSAGRVAIIGNEDEERLATDINTLLAESFRVPNAKLDECCKALREQARVRIGGAGGGRWTRSQLEQVIRRHDGYIASSPELDHYVHPTNWAELRAAMSEWHAVLIIGQSGTGKTMATRKLYDELRNEMPGLARVPITLGPDQIRDDVTDPPVLYDIEDPWGRYDFDPKSRPWNDQLAQFFAKARPNRMIVATSRLDVAQSAGALETVKPWRIELEAEHYGQAERRRLYRTRIDALPRTLQRLAKESEGTVLAELATPLEIQKFFDALPILDDKDRRNPAGLVAEAIRRAHQDSIERTVVDQIEERGDVRAAAVLWGLLKANDKLSLRLLREIEELLAENGPQFEKGVSPLVTFFVAARNLRQTESTVTYYHPRVEAGIEQALDRDRLVARRTLRLLIDILVSPDGPGEIWGIAASARLLLAADRTPELKPAPSATAQAKIDAWLASELANGGKEFEDNLNLAEAAGSTNSNVSEIARFLLHRPDRTFGWMHIWGPPEHEEAWYARMRADPAVKALVETFIRDVLPRARDDFRVSFVAEAERVAPGLTPAFLAAAATTVHYGVTNSHEAIAEAALNDLAGFEAVVDTAVAVRTPSAADLQSWAETRLAITNGEYSDDYAEHLSDNDDGWTAGEFLEAYVRRVRATVGWRHLAEHRHRDRLFYYWFRELAKDEAPDPTEITGAFTVGRGSKDEDDLWHVLAKAWSPAFEAALVERVLEGHAEPQVRLAALTCLAEQAIERLPAICQQLADAGQDGRLVEIAIDLGEIRRKRSDFDGSRHGEAAERAAAVLPPLLKEISDAAFALETKAAPILSDDASELLARARSPSEKVRLFRVTLDEHLPMFVPDDVRWLLANTDEASSAVEAIEAAIRHGITAEVEAGLSHRFATVVARALKAIATPLTGPLPSGLLALAGHKGSPVRKALVELLDAKPHPEHRPALLILAKDDWSPRSYYQGEEDDYPIAQAAIGAMGKLGALEDEVADELYRVAIDTRDSDVRYEIFALLVCAADARFQGQLFDIAVNPGRRTVRVNAAGALLAGHGHVMPETVNRITPQLLATRIEGVASRLLLLVAARAEMDQVLKAAEALSTMEKRRVLLLLAIWVVRKRDASAAERIARMLPANHAGVKWALAGAKGKLGDTALDDLGDPISVDQVLLFMAPQKKKTQ